MLQETPKARLTEITEALRTSGTPDARMAIELVRMCHEQSRDALVTAQGDNLYREQGKAQAFARLLKDLTTQPPTHKENR